MNKLLIEVYVPSINKLYDMFISYGLKVYELTIRRVRELAKGEKM